MNPSPNPPVQPAVLPLVALILGVLGLCLFPLLPVAMVLAIISLARSSQPAYAQRTVLAIIALVMPLVFIPVAGILAAIAIPNFIKYQARAKQVECRVNLMAALVGEESFRAEHDAYSTSPADVGFSPDSSRALYRFASEGPLSEVGVAPQRAGGRSTEELDRGLPTGLRARLGVHGTCPDCSITIACVNDVDLDPTLDVWSISSEERQGPAGPIPAKQPYNDVNDVTD